MFDHPIATIRVKEAAQDQVDSIESKEQNAKIIEFLDDLLANATEQGRPIQLLAVEPIPSIVRNDLSLQPVGDYSFTTQMLMNTYDDFPSVTQTVHYGIEIYNVFTGAAGLSADDSIEVDIGSIDAAYLDDGFHAKEYIPGAPTMRWTTDFARLTVPFPQDADSQEGQGWEIQVRAMIYRPDSVDPASVIVSVNDRQVGSFVPREEWSTFVFSLPNGIISSADSLQIGFATDAFVPADIDVNNDQRSLGFLLDWIQIIPASPQS
jgi:hypothetical protein